MTHRQWNRIASRIIKSELAKRGLTYDDLRKSLATIGVDEKTINIRNKIVKGTFSAVFFLQCLRSIGIKTLQLDDVFFGQDGKH